MSNGMFFFIPSTSNKATNQTDPKVLWCSTYRAGWSFILLLAKSTDLSNKTGMKSRSILKHMNNEMNGHKVYSVFHLCLGPVFQDKLDKWAIQYNPAEVCWLFLLILRIPLIE